MNIGPDLGKNIVQFLQDFFGHVIARGWKKVFLFFCPLVQVRSKIHTSPYNNLPSADHIERFNNAWQKESETESNDLRQNGQNIWDEFKQVQILGSGAFGAVVLSQKSSQPDQEKVSHLVAHLATWRRILNYWFSISR